ncbi:M48 family metalloprotease [Nocardia alba]|uniref:M48 family metalloprotease n=1 Tax=Nocardia alba TaxID=225051 RepID=UPI0008322D21|nr:M48 family metalloprotease [Nocardia alba]
MTSAPRRRRGIHLSTAGTLVVGLPGFALSLIVVGMAFSAIFQGSVAVWVALAVFVGSGAVVFFRPTEFAIARVFFRFRRPTIPEQERLDHAWSLVTQSAGVRADTYRLWVEDSNDLNASAAAGHIVAVTRGALILPPHQLEALLAHELGHHLGGHSWATLLTYWYALPGRLLVRVLHWSTQLVFALAAGLTLGAAGGAMGGRAGSEAAGCLIGPIVRLFPLLWLALITLFFYSIHPLLVLLWTVPFVLAWFGRHQEKDADRVAAQLGYGPALLEILYGWLDAGHDDARRRNGLRANIFASHPSCASRIHALEKRLNSQ